MSEAPHIPDHELLRLIGRGSYGEVWLARNVMGAGRAVKIVRRASFDSDRPFEREFAAVKRYEPASRMADGLVNVLHVGRDRDTGMFFYVMELADDEAGEDEDYRPRTLRSVMEKQKRLPLADCLTIAQSLAAAVASLHRTGLTHRDIKPSNIIFVNGRAKLADIGLVGDIGESRSFVGTEGYIPPEGPGLPGADLYALGMVLYETATGFPPQDYPRVPEEWMRNGDNASMEFVEVMLHATESDAARRYQSAGELLADLALLESGKSVRRVHLLERRWIAAKRIGALAAVLTLLGGGGFWLWHQGVLREQRAVAAEELTAQARRDERGQRFLALRERAARLVRSELGGWRHEALADIDNAAKLQPNDVELRNTLITALSRADLTERTRWTQPGGTTAGPVPSDDGSLVAVAQSDGTFRILRTADSTEVQHVRHWLAKIQPEFESRFTRDGRYFGAHFRGMRTLLPVVDKSFLYESFTWFRVSDGKIVLELPAQFTCDAAPPEGHHILACDRNARELVRYDLDTGKEVSRVPIPMPARKFLTSPDGKLAALQTEEGQFLNDLVLVDTATGAEVARWKNLHYMSGAVAWTPDSQRILLGGSAPPHGLRIIRVDRPGAPPERLVMHSAELMDIAVSPDGRHVLTGSWDQTTLLTDLVLRRTVAVLPGWSHAGSLGFSKDGRRCWRRVVEGVRSAELLLCDFEKPLAALHAMPALVNSLAFSPDGRWLAAAHDGGFTMLDLTNGRARNVKGVPRCGLCAITMRGGTLVCAVVSVEGIHLITCDGAGNWSASPALPDVKTNINALSAAGSTGRIHVWCGGGPSFILENGALTEIPGTHEVVSGGVAADGRFSVFSAGGGAHLHLRDAAGNEIAKLPAGSEPWVAISPDGARCSANSLRRIHCWDTATQRLLWERDKDFPFIRGSPLHTPDGRFVIARPGLHPVMFDAATGESFATLAPALPSPVTIGSAALSADGSLLALPGRGWVLVWDLQSLAAELNRL